jgi:probable rRNA maturation factor
MMEITNLTNEKIDKRLLRDVFDKTLEIVKIGKKPEISLVFVTEDRIREINKKYRNKNEVTDVLSFEGLNEIYVCPSAVKNQAGKSKNSFTSELMRVLIHGILHLEGYEHEKNGQEAARMKKLEEKIFLKINPFDKLRINAEHSRSINGREK